MYETFCLLWFDVEERYNTTKIRMYETFCLLWFDVEERYNTTDIP